MLTAGPVWLGPVQDSAFIAAVRDEIPYTFNTAPQARELCDTLAAELDEPTHYDQHKLCRNWGLPANAMDDFLADLRDAGYEASRAHYGGTTFKTDASVGEIRAATADSLE